MKLVKPNSAHYNLQQKYLQYLKSIKVGDTVYPAYDGKGRRATACIVKDIRDDKLVVEGPFWASQGKVVTALFNVSDGEGWVVYEQGEPTLMDYLFDKDQLGDYYALINPNNCNLDKFL